jgi:hypothetical protein
LVRDHDDAPPEVVDRLRAICARLPESYEEPAWIGTRWRIRKRTFVHVYTVDDGWPPAYAQATSSTGPLCAMTFRSSGPELEALTLAGPPFFKPPWSATVVGMLLDDDTDWDEVAELLTVSYLIMAPKRLAAVVSQTTGPG